MSGRGPLPNPAARRRAHNRADVFPVTRLPAAGFDGKPPPLPEASRFSAGTRRWYATWTKSPQATAFMQTDWTRLWLLAHLVEKYLDDATAPVLAEIRLQEAALGATLGDRRRLRMEPDETPAAPVLKLDDPPRRRLLVRDELAGTGDP